MSALKQSRRSVIIHELCRLSRNSWKDARPCDYEPLEAELRTLDKEPKKKKKKG